MLKKLLSLAVIFCFFLNTLGPIPQAHADSVLNLPAPGTMIDLSPAYQPVIIRGLTVHRDNPFLFDFIVDVGQDHMTGVPLKREGEKLIKYFLASLAIPDKDFWVNLSPYEKEKIIPEALSQTDMGRDLLEQDYILKQMTASLIYPEKQLGKEFWNRVYAKAQEQFGTTQIPVNTFNKVWIMADRAQVFEHNQTAFVVDQHLKVMLEEDYLALQKHMPTRGHVAEGYVSPSTLPSDQALNVKAPQGNPSSTSTLTSQIVKQIVLPELENEVNTGKNFANLRQIFNSIILSSWYKNNLKQALLNQVYADKGKVKGINLNDTTIKEQIYQQYLKAYKKGVFNYIKEDIVSLRGTSEKSDVAISERTTIPRKYFSGGILRGNAAMPTMTADAAILARVDEGWDQLENMEAGFNPAMSAKSAISKEERMHQEIQGRLHNLEEKGVLRSQEEIEKIAKNVDAQRKRDELKRQQKPLLKPTVDDSAQNKAMTIEQVQQEFGFDRTTAGLFMEYLHNDSFQHIKDINLAEAFAAAKTAQYWRDKIKEKKVYDQSLYFLRAYAQHGEITDVMIAFAYETALNEMRNLIGEVVAKDSLRRAMELFDALRVNAAMSNQLPWETEEYLRVKKETGMEIVGYSQAIHQVLQKVQYHTSNSTLFPILISGKTGSGKELISLLISKLLSKSSTMEPFIINVNRLNGLSGDRLEDTFFGANGYIAKAGGFSRMIGTIVLDGIEDASPTTQGFLLELLEENRDNFTLLNDERIPRKKVQMIGTINKRFPEEYRKDLINRFKANINLPPLSERADDDVLLYEYYNHLYSGANWKPLSLQSGLFLHARASKIDDVRKIQNLVLRVLEYRKLNGRNTPYTTIDDLKLADPDLFPGSIFAADYPDQMDINGIEIPVRELLDNTSLKSYWAIAHGQIPYFYLPEDNPISEDLIEQMVKQKDAEKQVSQFNYWLSKPETFDQIGLKNVFLHPERNKDNQVSAIKSIHLSIWDYLPNGEYIIRIWVTSTNDEDETASLTVNLSEDGLSLWVGLYSWLQSRLLSLPSDLSKELDKKRKGMFFINDYHEGILYRFENTRNEFGKFIEYSQNTVLKEIMNTAMTTIEKVKETMLLRLEEPKINNNEMRLINFTYDDPELNLSYENAVREIFSRLPGILTFVDDPRVGKYVTIPKSKINEVRNYLHSFEDPSAKTFVYKFKKWQEKFLIPSNIGNPLEINHLGVGARDDEGNRINNPSILRYGVNDESLINGILITDLHQSRLNNFSDLELILHKIRSDMKKPLSWGVIVAWLKADPNNALSFMASIRKSMEYYYRLTTVGSGSQQFNEICIFESMFIRALQLDKQGKLSDRAMLGKKELINGGAADFLEAEQVKLALSYILGREQGPEADGQLLINVIYRMATEENYQPPTNLLVYFAYQINDGKQRIFPLLLMEKNPIFKNGKWLTQEWKMSQTTKNIIKSAIKGQFGTYTLVPIFKDGSDVIGKNKNTFEADVDLHSLHKGLNELGIVALKNVSDENKRTFERIIGLSSPPVGDFVYFLIFDFASKEPVFIGLQAKDQSSGHLKLSIVPLELEKEKLDRLIDRFAPFIKSCFKGVFMLQMVPKKFIYINFKQGKISLEFADKAVLAKTASQVKMIPLGNKEAPAWLVAQLASSMIFQMEEARRSFPEIDPKAPVNVTPTRFQDGQGDSDWPTVEIIGDYLKQNGYQVFYDGSKPGHNIRVQISSLETLKNIQKEANSAMRSVLQKSSVNKDIDHAASAIASTRGGIDLNISNGMQTVIKDGQGVQMNINPAMLARIEREGIDSLSPVILRMTPITSIWPLVGLRAPTSSKISLS